MDSSSICRSSSRESRLVLFPLPFQGHINPMLQLANIFHSRGFRISIIHTRFNSPNRLNYPHFSFHPISDALPPQAESAPDPVRIIKLININCLLPFRHCLQALLAEGHVICLISDANWYFTHSVAHSLNLPTIVMRTSSVASFLAFAALSLLREKGSLSNRESKMEEPVEELPPLKVKDLPLIEMYNSQDAYANISRLVEEMKKASAIIFNTVQELEQPEIGRLHQQFPPSTFAIPFHKCFSAASSSLIAPDRSAIAWLEQQAPKSVLYVSFGSVAAMDGGKLREMAWGLANSKERFLWAVRPGLVQNSEWIEMLPEGFLEATSGSGRGMIIKWAPQQEVLSHPSVGGFWTHCGWNSTLESICEGVPMMCSPFFGDQLVNARYVSDVWRVGINLEDKGGLERGEIESGIRRLMVEREGEEMRERGMALKEKIDAGLNMGGSSYNTLDQLVAFISSFGKIELLAS